MAKIIEHMVKEQPSNEKKYIESCEVFSQGNIYISFTLSQAFNEPDLTSFKSYLIDFLEKRESDYTKALDSVGDKIYYLYKNAFDSLRNNKEDMKNGCIYKAHSLLNKGLQFSKFIKYDKIDWDIFKNNITALLNNVNNYVSFVS